jgi:hypothetical protein
MSDQQSTLTATEALEAIQARLQGVFDNPSLVKFGPLGGLHQDILSIAQSGLAKKDEEAFPRERGN